MERIEGLSIGLDLDSLKLERGLTGLKDKLRTVNSEMKANMSAFDRSDRSISKYETRLQGLNKKLEVQKAVTKEAKAEYEKMVKEHGEGSKEAEKAAREYNHQAAALNNLERYVEGVSNELKQLQEEQRIASSGWGKIGKSMDELGTKLTGIGDKMKSVGKSMSMYVTAPIVGFGAMAAKTGIDFDDSMAKVQAVSGATGDDLLKLRDKAKEMGATTKFSASESAEALNYMAMAGWKTEQMLDGLEGVMSLAAASGEDLGTVSDIVTDALTAFGMEAKESGKFADILAAASANANTNVGMLGKSFEYVAPVAGALGFTAEDVSVGLGLMANAGIKADKAGTALRTMMTNLSKPTKEMGKQMAALGISITDVDGNMLSFDQVMQDLRVAFGDLTEAEQASAAATIFGKEAMSGALAIINASEEDYNKLTKAINNSEGAAKKMAEIMEGKLGGTIREIKSGLEGFAISIYEIMEPALSKGAEKIKGLVEGLNNLSPSLKIAAVVFAALAAAIGPVIGVAGIFIGLLGNIMTGLAPVMTSIAKAGGLLKWLRLGFVGLTGPIGLTIGALTLLGSGFVIAYKKSETFRNQITKITEGFKAIRSVTDSAIPKFDIFGKEVSKSTEKAVGGFLKLSDKATRSLEDMFWRGEKVTEEMAGSLSSKFGEMNDQIIAGIKDRNRQAKESLNNLFADSKAMTDAEKEEALKKIEERTKSEIEKTEKGQKKIQEILNRASKEKRQITEQEKQAINTIQENMVEHGVKVLSKNEIESKAILERMKAQAENLSAQQAADVVKSSKKQRDKSVKEARKQADETIQEAIYQRDVLGTISTEQADKLIKEAEKQRDETVKKSEEMHEKIVEGAREKAGEHEKLIDWETGSVLTKWQAFKKGVTGTFTDMEKGVFSSISSLSDIFSKITEIAKPALGEVTTFFKDQGKVLQDFWKENGDTIIQAVQNIGSVISVVFQGIWKVIQFIMPAVLVIIKTVWGSIKGIIVGVLDIIMGLVKVFSGVLTGDFSKMWEGIKQIFSGAVKIVWNLIKVSFVGQIIKAVIGFVKDTRDRFLEFKKNMIDPVVSAVSTAKDKFNNFKNDTINLFIKVKDKVSGYVSDMVKYVKDMPGKMANGIKNMGYKVYDSMKGLANKMVKGLGKGVNGVIGGVNWVLERLNVPKKNRISEWPVPQYAHGTDGHPGGLAVVGDGKGNNAGKELVRTPDGQTYLSPAKPTLVNLPKGTHVWSALETKALLGNIPHYAWGTIKKGASKVKDAIFNVWDYIKKPGKLLEIALEKIGATKPDNADIFGKIARGGFNMVKKKAVDFIKDKFNNAFEFAGDIGNISGTGVQRWAGVATQALMMTGQFSPANLNRLLFQMKTESGGNPRAINLWDINAKRGIPSKGLMQVIDPTFQAYKMPGYNNIWNPLDNILASIRYAVARYGSLARAYRGVGYATGGLIKNAGLYNLAEGGYPEWVIPTDPKRRTDAMKLLALAGRDIAGNKRPHQLPNAGTGDDTAMADMLDAILEQNEILLAILKKDWSVEADGRTIAEVVGPHMERVLDNIRSRKRRSRGYAF